MGQGDRHDPIRSPSRRCAASWTRCRSTARSSSARASATRRRCSTSARRSASAHALRGGASAGGFPQVDIAVDPLEGTNLCATGAPNAIAVLAASNRGGLLHAPDLYMEKLVVGPSSKDHVSLDAPVHENLKAIAGCLGRRVEDLVVIVLERPRHEKLIADIRATGARIRLIGDGDLSAGIAAAVVGSRRPRGDGHRRRAGRRADGGGDALPERRDLRAARRQQARARGALPRDGHHGLQEGLSRRRIWRRARASSSRRPASPTAR